MATHRPWQRFGPVRFADSVRARSTRHSHPDPGRPRGRWAPRGSLRESRGRKVHWHRSRPCSLARTYRNWPGPQRGTCIRCRRSRRSRRRTCSDTRSSNMSPCCSVLAHTPGSRPSSDRCPDRPGRRRPRRAWSNPDRSGGRCRRSKSQFPLSAVRTVRHTLRSATCWYWCRRIGHRMP